MAKTIKQMADALGVDKQRVYRYIKKNCISEAHQKNGVMYYDEVVEKRIKQAFSQNEPYQESASSDTVFDVLLKQSEMLRKELEIKNKQISDLNDRLAECQKLLDQYQKLSAMEKVVQKIELENNPEKEKESLTPSSAEPETRKKAWWKFWES